MCEVIRNRSSAGTTVSWCYDVMCEQRGAFNEQYVLVQERLAQSSEQERPAVMALH